MKNFVLNIVLRADLYFTSCIVFSIYVENQSNVNLNSYLMNDRKAFFLSANQCKLLDKIRSDSKNNSKMIYLASTNIYHAQAHIYN